MRSSVVQTRDLALLRFANNLNMYGRDAFVEENPRLGFRLYLEFHLEFGFSAPSNKATHQFFYSAAACISENFSEICRILLSWTA